VAVKLCSREDDDGKPEFDEIEVSLIEEDEGSEDVDVETETELTTSVSVLMLSTNSLCFVNQAVTLSDDGW
jgi:hypothetical protein